MVLAIVFLFLQMYKSNFTCTSPCFRTKQNLTWRNNIVSVEDHGKDQNIRKESQGMRGSFYFFSTV